MKHKINDQNAPLFKFIHFKLCYVKKFFLAKPQISSNRCYQPLRGKTILVGLWVFYADQMFLFSHFSAVFFNLIKSITSNHQTARAAKFSKMDLISLLILEPIYSLPSRKKKKNFRSIRWRTAVRVTVLSTYLFFSSFLHVMLALEYRGIITSSLTILDLSWHDNKACGKKSCQVVGRRCCCLPFDRRCFMWNKERFVKLGFKIQVQFYQKNAPYPFNYRQNAKWIIVP